MRKYMLGLVEGFFYVSHTYTYFHKTFLQPTLDLCNFKYQKRLE